MVKHNVCVSLKEPTTENINKMKQLMLSVKDNISVVKNVSVEKDILHTPMSFDMMLFVEFDSRDELMQFIAHPYHAEYIQNESAKYVNNLHVFDFEY